MTGTRPPSGSHTLTAGYPGISETNHFSQKRRSLTPMNEGPIDPEATASSTAVETSSIYRIMDANGNRAREGLRVVEDYLRFGLEDSHLTRRCKQLRHDLSKTLLLVSGQSRLQTCRSTRSDVGTSIQTRDEYTRTDLNEIVDINLSRVTEAIRVLEEFSKTVASDAAVEFERIRYDTYTIGKSITHCRRGRDQLGGRYLYALVSLTDQATSDWKGRVTALLDGGVDVIQLRDKSASDREIIDAGRLLREMTREFDALFIVNDRPDLANAVGADGVHVGQEEMRPADVRRVIGPDRLIGVSTHTVEQARQAVMEGADYLGVGPVFPSRTKSFTSMAGLAFVAAVHKEMAIPHYAIGGIDVNNVGDVLDCGTRHIAVGHALWNAEEPRAAAQAMRALLVAQDSETSC